MQLTISHNFPDVQRRLDALRNDTARVVAARALNRTAEQARTQMSREIRAEFNLKAAKVNEKLKVKRATFKAGMLGLQAELSSRDPSGRRRAINVVSFGARKTKAGVSVKIKRSGARKTIRGAFIGNKGRTVFIRVGTKRLPIKPVQTIDVPQMFNVRRINAAVVAAIRGRFPVIFERELAYELSKFSGR